MIASAAVESRGSAPNDGSGGAFLPLVVFPRDRAASPDALAGEVRGVIRRHLPRAGVILFRGFRVLEDADFERFIAAAGPVEAAPEGARVWAWCAVPGRDQRVWLADRRELHRAIPASIRRRWSERGLAYELLDERGSVLLSRRRGPVVLHRRTHEALWVQLEHAARAGSFGDLSGVAADDGERHGAGSGVRWTVRHGDGAALDELDVHEVNSALASCRCELSLDAMDVLLIEPSLVAHSVARGAGKGIVVHRAG